MLSILYNIIISPIEFVVEIVFEMMFRLLGQRETNQELAIIGVSVAISVLTLPLYRRADAVQQKERDTQKHLSGWVSHIKKNFKGDERFMMLQTYYRENGYSPLQALNGSVTLLLEIPFFIAAYHFLSHLAALKGASFGVISDLGSPDELVKLCTVSVNLLPMLMTAINCISSAVYLKGFPLKDKVQTYGMALIFLVLLYNSPSVLVLYWTCNNIFSLVKNIFYKLRNPRKIVTIVCAVLGSIFAVSTVASGILNSRKKYIAVCLFECIMVLPLFIMLFKRFFYKTAKGMKNTLLFCKRDESNSLFVFMLLGTFLTILTGILIPSAVIASSPAEFLGFHNYRSPLLFLVNSTCYAAGFFLLWAGIICYMMNEEWRGLFNLIMWVASGVFLFNYMCFGRHLGLLSPTLAYEEGLSFSELEIWTNFVIVLVLSVLLVCVFKCKKIIPTASSVLAICAALVSLSQMHRTQSLLNDMSYQRNSSSDSVNGKVIKLSKKGKNVIVFMLDRAINGYVPYIFNEEPSIKNQFAGFTYYPNTVSHGFFTNFGTPALFGGYEYTVSEMNKRTTKLLVEKHNEALHVLPKLFDENNFEVTVCDPPYAGYKWIPDLSIFDDIPDIKTFNLYLDVVRHNSTAFLDDTQRKTVLDRNFFAYSIFKILPLMASKAFYNDGKYFESITRKCGKFFNGDHEVLSCLPNITEITDYGRNIYCSITNCTTHDLDPNSSYEDTFAIAYGELEHPSLASYRGMDMQNCNQVIHYAANFVAFRELGTWFDFMRENGVYDNTRIILVADHGRGLAQFDYMLMKNPKIDVQCCNPLLMVKDFGATEFTVSHEFMTNADVPTLATEGIIEKPVNPFTGKLISTYEKTAHPQMVTSSEHWQTDTNCGTTFDTADGHWFSVHDDIFNEENWTQLD